MNIRIIAILPLLLSGPAQALTANISGDVRYSYYRDIPGAPVVNLSDRLDFNEALPTNGAARSFGIFAPTVEDVGASVVTRVGDGWMRTTATGASSIQAVSVDGEASGASRFRVFMEVTDTITIDAPGMTGMLDVKPLGFLIDGVFSTGVDASYPRSDGYAEGAVSMSVSFNAVNNVSDGLSGQFQSCCSPGQSYSNVFLGGLEEFIYGTPFQYRLRFQTEGRQSASSDGTTGVPWEPVSGLQAASSVVSDFGHTITWAGIPELRDSDGNLITDFTAVSGGGADFRYAITPPPIPVPGAVWLFATGLLGLLGVSRLSTFGHWK